MTSGSRNTTTNTSTAEPWTEAQPFLEEIYGGARDAYRSGEGFKFYPESTVVPFSGQTTSALGQISSLANQGSPMASAAQTQGTNILNSGGMSDWQRGALGGAYDVATGARDVSAIRDNLSGYASGDYVTGGSPAFQEALNRQAERLTDDINRSVSIGGRYGSPYHANTIAEGVGNFRQNAMLAELARQEQNQIQAAGMLGQEQGANIANLVGAGGQIFGAGNQAANQVAQFSGLTPAVYGAQFQPAERLASVGAQYEDLSTRELQDQISRFNAGQQEPWSQLAAYNALIGGAGQLGGTTTTTAQQPANYLAPFGGALAGAELASMGALGPLGPFAGALLGGGVGLFGI